jgi:exonuclease VII large subunit
MRRLDEAESSIASVATTIRAYDPDRALDRGWSITRRVDGSLARAREMRPGDRLVTVVADGELRSVVEKATTVTDDEHR